MWDIVFIALGLCLVFEGLIPTLAPNRWRLTMLQLIQLPTNWLRLGGFITVIAGAALIMWTTKN